MQSRVDLNLHFFLRWSHKENILSMKNLWVCLVCKVVFFSSFIARLKMCCWTHFFARTLFLSLVCKQNSQCIFFFLSHLPFWKFLCFNHNLFFFQVVSWDKNRILGSPETWMWANNWPSEMNISRHPEARKGKCNVLTNHGSYDNLNRETHPVFVLGFENFFFSNNKEQTFQTLQNLKIAQETRFGCLAITLFVVFQTIFERKRKSTRKWKHANRFMHN